jgi:serine/threonine protein phosphatase 1
MAFFRWSRASRSQFDAPLAPDHAVIVLGDIHGRSDLLDQMLTRLARLTCPAAHLVCVGDYVDRGDESAAVLRRVMTLQKEAPDGAMVCLMGNHEKMMLEFLDAPEAWGPRWTRHGGLQTLASFQVGLGPVKGGGAERDWRAIRDALRAAMPPDLEAWLRALPLTWQSGNLFVAHAGADPQRAIADQKPRGLLWGGEGFYDIPRSDGIWVAHGHVITGDAQPVNGRIPVDTGAYATGRLTAAVIEPGRVEFIQT